MSTQALPLSLLCNVSVMAGPLAVASPSFNQSLFIGSTAHIPSQGPSGRVRQYATASFPQNMIADGFALTDPEYLCAQLYCSQTPLPQFFWIGRRDLTAVGSIGITGGHAGTGYAAGDVFAITEAGETNATGTVTAATAGVPTAVQIVTQGTGASLLTGNVTTAITGTGVGLQVDILTLGESPVQALAACRLASTSWYTASVCGATTADHLACAAFAQSAIPQMQYLYTTADSTVLSNASGNVAAALKAGGYSRTHGTYATTQGGAYPSQPYASAAVAGLAMGMNTGLANSNFTLALKLITGLYPEPLTLSQLGGISGVPGTGLFGNNVNTYIAFADGLSRYEQGTNANGAFFDQILGLDMLAADCQQAVVNLYSSMPSVPQTDAGQALLMSAVVGACQRSVTRGFISGGVWTGQTIDLGDGSKPLTPGTALPNGYRVMSPLVRTQAKGDRAARKAMPIYVAIIESGSQQSATVGVYVQV